MGARARLLMTMTGLETVIISRAVPALPYLMNRDCLRHSSHISHVSANRPCDGTLPWNIASTGWPVKRRPRGTFGGRRRPGTSGTPGAARPTAWVPGRRPLPAARCGLLVGHPTNTATAYRRDLRAWSTWCAERGVHPLATERHVDAWVRHLTTNPQPRTGRPASAATVARKLLALAGFYDYGLHDAGVLTHSPAASVRRPKVADESQAIGLVADELKRLLAAVAAHSSRSAALVSVFMFCGLRISEALGADVRDFSHDQGHRVFEVTRKGGKAGRVALAPPGRPSSRRLPRGADQRTAVPRP